MNEALHSKLSRFQMGLGVFGLVALAASVIGAVTQRQQFFFSYLFGCLFWVGLSVGCLAVTMIHELTGGRWGYPTRRFLEAGFMSLPLMAVLFIPVFFGLTYLYPWARPLDVAAEKTLQERQVYENVPGYVIRSLVFLAVLTLMAFCLRKWSLEQDKTTDAAPTRKARTLSGPGLVIYGLLGTMAYVDWIMSLEKHWYSTMFVVIVLAGQILLAFAFSVVLLTLLRNQAPFTKVVNKTHYHHLGNLLLTFVIFWTYVSFGQLLIIYSGDLPHEVDWYLHRIATNWKLVVALLAGFHFFLPFFLLLFRTIKKNIPALTVLAGLLFVLHVFETYWLVMPSFHQTGMAISWLDFVLPVGIGSVWLAFFLFHLKGAPLILQNDPGLQFAFVYGR